MPRKESRSSSAKKSEDSDTNSKKISKNATVANVNKTASVVQTRSTAGGSSSKATCPPEKPSVKRKIQLPQSRASSQAKKSKAGIPDNESASRPTECRKVKSKSTDKIEVMEGDQQFTMEVDAEDDPFCQSEEDSDSEVELNTTMQHNQSSQRSNSQDEDSQSEAEELSGLNPSQMTPNQRRQRIKEIDAEMLGKMRQLHELMSAEGMTTSVDYIEKNFEAQGEAIRPCKPPREAETAITKLSQVIRESQNQVMQQPRDLIDTGLSHKENVNQNHKSSNIDSLERTKSVETIYRNAIEKRGSSSSEDCVDISDENLGFFVDPETDADFQPDYEMEEQDQPEQIQASTSHQRHDYQTDKVNPAMVDRRQHNSRSPRSRTPTRVRDQGREQEQEVYVGPTETARNAIIDAEANKISVLPHNQKGTYKNINKSFEFTAKIDQDYLVVGGHVDESTQSKIINGEYVDFGKLLPRDQILSEEDGRLELVIRNGRTYWTPVTESVVINSFSKWEQAFRVFANIYTRKFPHKSSELIQYNHVIHSISSLYTWENVYGYDKEFRIHLSKHPDRSWSVILQQAWSMKLRDRISFGGRPDNHDQTTPTRGNVSNNNWKQNGGASGSKEPCRHYNRGKCNFGTSCKFDHRCAYEPCGKFGHNILNCRKLAADRTKLNGRNSGGSKDHEHSDKRTK